MTIYELDAKAAAYFELQARIAAMTADVEAIKEAMKAEMVAQGVEELAGHGWRATWHNSAQTKFDAKKFRLDHADLYNKYARTNAVVRFTLNQVKA